ncbi:S-adenosyl-L-methionine-dependent methyltransferase [Boletus edulis BED1]|uniref:S-adenosyl-L-methionine-dependent methyltransferase n=1 Tax=Boletus edulis BED1 TaxID=1328754 RepID=A0AAD4GF61_BOLED|nr:S-adenosyl-L-methionine-dependent methyltransferase [Boletus edulis BED1]
MSLRPRKDSASSRVKKRPRIQKRRAIEPYSHDDVLWHDVRALLGNDTVHSAEQHATDWDAPFQFREELEVVVDRLSSNGDALALAPPPRSNWVIVAPFALPGERIRVRVYRGARLHSFADLLDVLNPNPDLRDDSRVQCKYFGQCSGCQYQMLSYEKQLEIKRDVVVKAYQNFSGLPFSAVPTVLPTMGSPKQYHYRTKITPHFEAPPKKARADPPSAPSKPDWLKIGFNEIGKKTVIDIEECPIATPVLNQALGPIRENIIQNIWSYKKGVSLLLRDSLDPSIPIDLTNPTPDEPTQHICVTDHKATVRERVGDTYFEFPGHAFFQNNNSILVPLTNYVRDAIFPSTATSTDDNASPTHLVDAYCGSGLFSILLSPHFHTVAGIELATDAIRSATANAQLNRLPPDRCTFLAGDASDIFATVSHFPREKTAVIIDPPRKGCDTRFLEQLLEFGAGTVVYVSCNVHTQARDVGMIVKRSEESGVGGPSEQGTQERTRKKYVLESLKGFDLFPQTAHVESVAVLRLVSVEEDMAN